MLLECKGDEGVEAKDRFTRVADDASLPTEGGVLVSLSRLREEQDELLGRAGGLGVWLASDESPSALVDWLARLDLVALDFPVFSDGRAFSSARLLRERYGWKGELRAIGDVLCEQLPFMIRSGFDTFEMASPKALEEFRAVVNEVRVVYQPTGDGRSTALEARHSRDRQKD